MEWNLNADELRVLGSLLEKQATTPDQYPLSVNALVSASNQKSNREPVMALSEGDVGLALNGLLRRSLIRHASGYGGRVSKYEHRVAEGAGGPLALDARQRAVLCLLLLRGPQTPGELRGRSHRLAEFPDIATVEETLQSLEQHPAGALVERLPREAGKRESRYLHTLGSEESRQAAREAAAAADAGAPAREGLEQRVRALEDEVAVLRSRLDQLDEALSG